MVPEHLWVFTRLANSCPATASDEWDMLAVTGCHSCDHVTEPGAGLAEGPPPFLVLTKRGPCSGVPRGDKLESPPSQPPTQETEVPIPTGCAESNWPTAAGTSRWTPHPGLDRRLRPQPSPGGHFSWDAGPSRAVLRSLTHGPWGGGEGVFTAPSSQRCGC